MWSQGSEYLLGVMDIGTLSRAGGPAEKIVGIQCQILIVQSQIFIVKDNQDSNRSTCNCCSSASASWSVHVGVPGSVMSGFDP